MVNYQAHRIITFICSLRALDIEIFFTALDRCAAHKPHVRCAQPFDTTWHNRNFFALIPYDSKRDAILHFLWLVIDHILTASRELFLQNCFILASYPRFVNQSLSPTTLSKRQVVRRGYVRIGGMCDTLVAYIIVLSYRLRFFAWRCLRPTNHHQAPPPPAAVRTTATAMRIMIVQLGPSSCLRMVGC